tara:strand:- start:2821 stop:4518 length:1698 start_codon:yes stop_codon:yes gene_type:complete
MSTRLLISMGCMLLLVGCDRAAPPESAPPAAPTETAAAPWFTDVTKDSGIDFVWNSGQSGDYLLPEIIGGGVALLDMDDDGDLDVYLVQGGDLVPSLNASEGNGHVNRLYRNEGGLVFTDITESSGTGDSGYGQGVATGDYDGDGDTDIYITNVGPNTMLRNEGNGVFTDASISSGTNHPGWGTSCAFADFDHDGDLDLYVTNYIGWSHETELDCSLMSTGRDYCSPRNYDAPARDVLYENLGDGRFADATKKSGIDASMGNGLGVICADFNDDGSMDIFVANDGNRDLLWSNNGNGTFHDIGLLSGCALDDEGRAKAGMGVTANDIDDDGDMDLLVCNLAGESDSLFRNEGDHFIDITSASELKTTTRPFTRFGIGWIDFDNDGHLDLYEANGRVLRPATFDGDDPYAQENLLLRGDPDGTFTEVRPRGGVTSAISRTSRAAAFGDLDNDGGMDVIIVNRDAPITMLHNTMEDRGNWIGIRAMGPHGDDAIGAVISAEIPGRTLTRPVLTGYSYLAANDPRIHLGLGAGSSLNKVRIRWPDGTTESFGSLPGGSVHLLRQGSGH